MVANPTIRFVHLIIGGNDFLSQVETTAFGQLSDEERAARWESITADIGTIVDACIAVRDDVNVVIAGYDYLDFEAARKVWKKDFHGASTEELNRWLRELGDRKKQIADQHSRCEYIPNWGTLQRWFGDQPDSSSDAGGDPSRGMP